MLLFVAGLPVMNGCFTVFPLLSVYLQPVQTSNGSGGLCTCYHNQSFHLPSPVPDICHQNAHHTPAVPVPPGPLPPVPVPAHPFLSFTGPMPPALFNLNPSPPLGIPSNQATPILRSFHPYQAQPSSSSEDNRKKSIGRMNLNKPRRKARTIKTHDQLSPSDSINRELSVLLFPLNVRYIFTHLDSLLDYLKYLVRHVSSHPL